MTGARPPLVILGNPENRRVGFALRAAESLGWQEVSVVPWLAFLRDQTALARELSPDGWLRIESPGENFEVEKALLRLGARGAEEEAEEEDFTRLTVEAVNALPFRRGEILPMRQWYGGWRGTLLRVSWCLAEAAGCRAMNPPWEITAMFDKARCHEIFATAGVPRPQLLGLPASYEHLRETMRAAGCGRVFLKPCHSSSASGVVALEAGRTGVQAFSSVEMADGRLFNSLAVRHYREPRQIAALVDAVCRQRAVAERWFPKAGFDGQRFDLRVLVIGGRAAHVVMRQSAGPITNLHLGNRRGDLAGLRGQTGDRAWQDALDGAVRAARAFPASLYVAVDLLVAPGLRRFAVAEVNAFGDLLPNLLHKGRDTYTAEFARLLEAPAAQVSTSGW